MAILHFVDRCAYRIVMRRDHEDNAVVPERSGVVASTGTMRMRALKRSTRRSR